MNKADVIIIGGGLMGSSSALQLALRGQRVIVLEKDHPGRHASGVNAGGLRKLNRHPAEIPLSLAASAIWADIHSLLGQHCDVKLCGQLRVAENSADMQKLEQRAALLESMGYQHEQIISRQRLYELAPALAPHCTGALYCADDGYARPYHALSAFRSRAEALGVEYHIGEQANALQKNAAGWLVHSARQTYQADAVINCGGAWAGQICEMLDEPAPLQVAAPMMMVSERVAPFLEPVIGAASRKLSFKQMQNGTLVIGGAHLAHYNACDQSTRMDFSKLAESARTVCALFPQLRTVKIVRSWCGLEAFMPDQLPVISASHNSPGIFHAFGFSAHGFQLSPVIGQIMAQLVLDGHSRLPIEAFSIQRFSQTRQATA
ncbi:MAG: FAD-binding oxidoreductase [gamma proteobacterium symbiont of Bathyaustriella thionipta]|nr:FAD-binding oxidoreductase [gamma proteobacterium symbiont of Bathyaustriella thionipta]